MICLNNINGIFCLVDEFSNNFEDFTKDFILEKPSKRPPVMSESEVITIAILFHLSGF